MAKRRALTFQTPRKKTATPLRQPRRPEPPAAHEAHAEQETLENKLVASYRCENALLRSLKQDALLYSKLLGIAITEGEDQLCFTIERDSTTGHKRLQFHLEEKDNIYVFRLDDSQNCSVPDYFYDIIEFDKKALPLFFYKAMQSVYEARVNE
ncbi:hypothetical protein PAPHI01_0956 [Pancytospora philotis]|nr:hypothetical protein PAPHI01_0956 [Pancytospora philotis]